MTLGEFRKATEGLPDEMLVTLYKGEGHIAGAMKTITRLIRPWEEIYFNNWYSEAKEDDPDSFVALEIF